MKKNVLWFYNQIIKEMKRNSPKVNKSLIKESLDFCLKKHEGQKRVSGEGYWIHPANVALTIAKLGGDPETISAALLHDTLEDTKTSEAELEKKFGSEITTLVKGVTKLDRISEKGTAQQYHAVNIQKIMLASSKDLRVMAVKLADKLHNIQTLKYLSKKSQIRTASQALTIFVPLAHKIGIHTLKDLLEDQSFLYVNKKKYWQLKKKLRKYQKEKSKQLNKAIKILNKKVKKINVVYGTRKKTVFSVYIKMNQTDKVMDELHDCTILTVETESVMDCYKMLGALHTTFLPVPGKVKDYIGTPQPNFYQAVHTTVIGPTGEPIKVYIATKKMNDFYRRGILALGSTLTKEELKQVKERLKQLDKLFRLPFQYRETEEFMQTLQEDSLSKTIFVFTPKGELVELPFGSTPIDFAFKIHPWLGKRLWRVKVNGQFVGLDSQLENGNVVEILSGRIIQLRKNWLDLANTISAKRTISRLLKQKQHQKNRPIDINVLGKDRAGILSEITYIFETEGVNISCTFVSAHRKKTTLCQFNIPPLEEPQLKRLVGRLRQIKDVSHVTAERA